MSDEPTPPRSSYEELMTRLAAQVEARLAGQGEPASAGPEPPSWVDDRAPDDAVAGVQQVADDDERAAAATAWPAPIDLAALAEHEPVAPRHIIPAWLPAGEVTLFAGHGGSGKSAIALHLAVCCALGAKWCGLEVEQRPVYFISCEDGAEIMHWRLARIARLLGVALPDLAGWIRIIDASRISAELMIDPGRGDEPMMTARYEGLLELIEPGSLIVLDGASDLFGASEILRRHVRRFVRALRQLAGEDGAVLLLGHIDKAAARSKEGGDRYSGSTAWHNSVRARWELQADGDALVLKLAKANHARAGAEIRLRWDDGAHMHLAADADPSGGVVATIRDRTEREAVLAALRGCAQATPPVLVPAALNGPRTVLHVLSTRPEFPQSLCGDNRATRTRFARHLEILRQSGAIRETSGVNEARHKVRIFEIFG